eukprot:TRINITY_DN23457_c0_g1_i1.p1 TRINITY_DN23457_c0_g1~~TRINITY_DN23457_c0_g1_i1.p1  ORF type:complete len:135 (+),score=10.36 TRINITY_DN23457_c0_g1_i1:1-405(+)
MVKEKWDPHAVVWKPKPLLQVRKHGDNGEWHTQRFLIDSGSWMTIVPYEVGRSLGFKKHPNEAHRRYLTTAQGNVPYTTRMMDLKPGMSGGATIPVAWADKGTSTRAAIGRTGVFDKYDITLNEADNSIAFTRL